jgi:MFS family permease
MTPPAPTALSARGRWLTLVAALLGWMFDGLEMGLFPLVARPALADLLETTSRTEISRWVAIITAGFLVGAATGGVLFGWLGDRIGRVRAMTLSILTYAIFSGLCGLATDAWQVAVCRFVASLGMGGEWSLGVALVMEVWPDRSRAWLAGVIGAAANFGYMLIAGAGLVLSALIADVRASRSASARRRPTGWSRTPAGGCSCCRGPCPRCSRSSSACSSRSPTGGRRRTEKVPPRTGRPWTCSGSWSGPWPPAC